VTTLAPPVGAFSASTGSIGVKILDSTGTVNPFLNVQIVGPVTQTLQTTTEGCAYFAFIAPGTYTVTVTAGTGVGDQEAPLPSQTASVTIGQTTSVQVPVRQGRDDCRHVAVAGQHRGCAAVRERPVAGRSRTPVCSRTASSRSRRPRRATRTTSPSLFPYSSGYTVYAGNCTDNNPLGKDTNRNPFYPGALTTPLNLPPSGTAATTVPLYSLAIHVQNGTAVAVPSTSPTVVETSAFGPPYTAVCTNGTATGTPQTLGLVTTNATGRQRHRTSARPLDGDSQVLQARGAVSDREQDRFGERLGEARRRLRGRRYGRLHHEVHDAGDGGGHVTRYRKWLRADRSQGGYTLIEMMIATALLSLGGDGRGSASSSSCRTKRSRPRIASAPRVKRRTMADRITKDLRTGGRADEHDRRVRVGRCERRRLLREPHRSQWRGVEHRPDPPPRVHVPRPGDERVRVPRGRDQARLRWVARQLGLFAREHRRPTRRPVHRRVAADLHVLGREQPSATDPFTDHGDGRPSAASTRSASRCEFAYIRESPTVVITTRIHVRNVDYNPAP